MNFFNSLKDTILALEFTNFCNCSCIMCTQSMMKEPKGFMNRNTFEKIIKDIVEEDLCFDKLTPFGLGESTLHPEFFEYMSEIFSMNKSRKYFRSIDLHTNAINLSDELIDLFIKHSDQLNTISFSIDAITEDTYLNIRNNRNFNQMIQNIRKFFIKRGNKRVPRANLQFIVMEENKHEAKAFKDYWSSFLSEHKIDFQINYDWNPPMVKDTIFFKRLNPIKHEEINKSESLHYNTMVDLGLIKTEKNNEIKEERAVKSNEYRGEPKRRYPCSGPFKYMMLNYSGELTVCCIDTLRELSLGNINDSSIINLWNSPLNHSYRLDHIKGDLSRLPRCINCNNLDSPDISIDELERYLKHFGHKDHLKCLEEL